MTLKISDAFCSTTPLFWCHWPHCRALTIVEGCVVRSIRKWQILDLGCGSGQYLPYYMDSREDGAGVTKAVMLVPWCFFGQPDPVR